MEKERHTENRQPRLDLTTTFPRGFSKLHRRTSSHTEQENHVRSRSPEGRVSVCLWVRERVTRTLADGDTNFVHNFEIDLSVENTENTGHGRIRFEKWILVSAEKGRKQVQRTGDVSGIWTNCS